MSEINSNALPEKIRIQYETSMQRIEMWVGMIKEETSLMVAALGQVSAPAPTRRQKRAAKITVPQEELDSIGAKRMKQIKIV